MTKKPAVTLTIIFCFLLSISHARFSSLLPENDAIRKATGRLFAVDLTETSDPDAKILLPTERLREPSDSASSSGVSLEAKAEDKENPPPKERVPDKDLPASGSFAGEITEDEAAEQPFDVSGEKRRPDDAVVVRFHPMAMISRHLDRTWTERRSFPKSCRQRNPDDHPFGNSLEPHQPFWGEENDDVLRKEEEGQRQSYSLPLREIAPQFHPQMREGSADGDGMMTGEFKRPHFHFFHHHFDQNGRHHNYHHDHDDLPDNNHEEREHVEQKGGQVWKKIRKFLT